MATRSEEYRSGEYRKGFQYQFFLPSHPEPPFFLKIYLDCVVAITGYFSLATGATDV